MSKTSRFDDRLKIIRRELRKLERTESPIARRNARKRVLSAMRVLRGAVDEAFPAIIDRTGVKRLKTPEGRMARLRREGWRDVSYTVAQDFAVLGIRVRKFRVVDGVNSYWKWFLPRWAVAIGLNGPRLREAKKSVKIRNAAIVAEALATP